MTGSSAPATLTPLQKGLLLMTALVLGHQPPTCDRHPHQSQSPWRRPLVQAAQRDRDRQQQHNLHFLFCNANISLEAWIGALPADQLQLVSIQFPDPWFKQRHRKRRVLQPALLLSIASGLHPGRHLFLQSDVLAVIEPFATWRKTSGRTSPIPPGLSRCF